MENMSPALQQYILENQNVSKSNTASIKTTQPKVDSAQKPDTFENSKAPQKKKIDKKKVIIGITIGAAVVAVAAFAIYKCKQTKILKTMPEELKNVFEGVKHKEGNDFIDSAYDGIKKYMDLDGIAPKKVVITNDADGAFGSIVGGYNFIENKIEYTKGFRDKLSKTQQFNLLSHELKHCKQYSEILRTEGLGAEAIAKATAEQGLNSTQGLLNGGKSFIEIVKESYSPKMAEAKITSERTKLTNDCLKKIETHYSDFIQSAKKHSANSAEGLQAQKYVDAIKKYEGLDPLFKTGSDAYRENLLEVEAYAFGSKMEKLFNSQTSFISRLKDNMRVIKANS